MQPDVEAGGTATSTVRVRVRFCETDLMGVVHHGSFIAWLEVARVEWLRRRGVAFAEWTTRGLHLAVVEMTLKYRSPARFDDEIDVVTTLAHVGAASFRFDYRLLRAPGTVVVAEASTRLACVTTDGRVRRITPEVEAVLARPESSVPGSWIAPSS